jgi:YD repeat-containing protein
LQLPFKIAMYENGWPIMKAVYDPKTDTVTFELNAGPVAESDEDKPGVILDYDKEGNLIGIEVLDASRRVADTRTMQFQVTES